MRQVRRREGVEEAAEGMRRLARVRVRFGELGFGVLRPEAELYASLISIGHGMALLGLPVALGTFPSFSTTIASCTSSFFFDCASQYTSM
jgi:hypothetical protein